MMNIKSVFQYKIIDKYKSHKEIIEKIDDELNRNLNFIITQTDENIITLAGERMGWITTTLRGNDIYINADDSFFSSYCVLEQILTSLWANLLDFGEIRLEKFQLSNNIHTYLASGNLNIQNIQKVLRVKGPYFGTVFKPSYSLSLSEKIEISKKFASIEGTFLKEDETYLIEKSKLLKESEAIQNAMNSISDHCYYVPNVTPYLLDDNLLLELCQIGIRVVMINYLIAGLPIVYKVVKRNGKLLFWGHRVGYKFMERYISMKAVAILAAYSGMNMIHIGTPFFSINNSVKERISIIKAINNVVPEVIPIFTKVSHEIIPLLMRAFGKKIIIMICGSIRTNGYLDWKKVKSIIDIVR
jgi:ribulose 1,5-bisphosphate carboxylase large subunit-like protein